MNAPNVDQQGRRNLSAVMRLRELPEVFTGRDLTVKFQWRSAMASAYLFNWRKAGLVAPLGGHSDVYMNLIKNPVGNVELAARRIYPCAVKIGVDMLREAGWTTQILYRPDLAVAVDGPRFRLNAFELQYRSPAWFVRIEPGLERVDGGLNRLRPAWAFADLLARALDRRVQGAWLLAPDDIDLELVRSESGIVKALEAFGLTAESSLTESGYELIYERLAERVAKFAGAPGGVDRSSGAL